MERIDDFRLISFLKAFARFLLITAALACISERVLSQTSAPATLGPQADTSYISSFAKKNDFRATYGTKSGVLTFGSARESAGSSNFYNNVTDIVGFGLSYKFIDFDLAFSLPQTKLLPQGQQNLSQFRLSGSYYGRQWTVQGYWRDAQGLVVGDVAGQFQSTPDVRVLVIGMQFTRNFNPARYSYKAANFQNELQRKSGGAFLLRIEPYFRKVGIGGQLVPPNLDVPQTYGEQAGLRYVNSPGINVLPGYGHTFCFRGGDFFVSPYLLAGGGIAASAYEGDLGQRTILNLELTGCASLNFGYNGKRTYAAIRPYYEISYFKLNPSYFVTTEMRAMLIVGYRFADVERAIPRL